MRIVREFNLGHVKCTMFHYNGKYTLKMEDELGEVHYKLGDIEIDEEVDIKDLLEIKDLRNHIRQSFENMGAARSILIEMIQETDEDQFDPII